MASSLIFRPDATALITGAAAGIGRAFAEFCAAQSMNLILVDRDETTLAETKAALTSQTSSAVHAWSMDVGNFSEWEKLRASFKHLIPDVLHLNAGIMGESSWRDHKGFNNILQVNVLGVTNGINAFIEDFDLNYGEHKAIIISGSKQGITNPPGNPAYNASKSAVNVIAEHLHYDLSKTSPHTAVHLFVPGWTWTPMNGSKKIATKPDGAWTPCQTVSYLVSRMEKGSFYVICPDNEVDHATDQKRILWTAGDMIYDRKPMSRWRKEYADESATAMASMNFSLWP